MTWESADKVQKNASGEYRALIGGEWIPVAKAQKSASGQYRIDRGQSAQPTEQPIQPEQSAIAQGAGNVLAGAAEGAGQIGATILSPIDWAARKLGAEDSALFPADRRQAITEGLRSMGAQPESALYQTGKIGAQIAGTAGVGGALAKGAAFAPELAGALRAGGFAKDAGLAANIAGGAATGAASAGLTGGDVGAGALIGGALPGGISAVKTTVPAILGVTTGAGSEAINQAFKAGTKGGTTAKAFTENLRGKVPVSQVLDDVNANIAEIGKQRSKLYQENMKAVGASAKPLSYGGIDKAVNNALEASVTSKGFIKNEAAADVQQKIAKVVEEAKSRGMNTAEDFDALKQRIGAIRESIPMNERTAQKVAGDVYNSIKGEIIKQEPAYAAAMKDYSDASELLGEIRQTLSNKPNATIDTQMRKLQSIMRNNVNTSYGNRLDLVREMEAQGGRQIAPAVAGQALSELAPRGLARVSLGGAGVAATVAPQTLAYAPFASPRFIGETAYGAGHLADLAGRVPFSQQGLEAARLAAIIQGAQ